MDVRLAQLRFQQKLQNHLDYEVDIRTIDIEYFLTKGQDLYIDRTYEQYKGQESLRKRLAGVYKDVILDRATYYNANEPSFREGEMWRLPSNVKYVMDEYILDASNNFIPVKPVDASYYNKQISNPFKKPFGNLVWRFDRGEKEDTYQYHELIKVGTFSISNYGFVYISTPSDVKLTVSNPLDIVQFEIVDAYHDEIVDLAVEFALDVYRVSGRLVEPKKQ